MSSRCWIAATSDELTGLFNRRGFLTLAEYALLTAQRRHEPVSLGVCSTSIASSTSMIPGGMKRAIAR
ncbi:diguanylate cyclase [Klebsiella pneumoniae]|uniref:Diguanylate cyclase n=1 Tax=Klebsiella pneumoniae TaxID=573 RepID=A0A377XBC7_KLEPN|nr:diguanylate cyclase [Klebsiella pneumoniae]